MGYLSHQLAQYVVSSSDETDLSGAVSLAAALSGKVDIRDKTVVVVSSGGNVDPALYAEILNG